MAGMSDTKAREWAAFLEPEELRGIVRAIGLFETTGVLPSDEAREWRRAILDRHGLPVGQGEA
jgi:hypothetical protein